MSQTMVDDFLDVEYKFQAVLGAQHHSQLVPAEDDTARQSTF